MTASASDDVEGSLEPPAALAGLDEVLVAVVAEAALRGRSRWCRRSRAGRTRRRRCAGHLAAEPGGAAGGGLHDAVVVQLELVLGDRADHDRGVGELPGEGVPGVEVEDVGDDDRDVVGAAAAQRELDQLLHGLLGALVAGEGVLQGLVGDDAGQAVGADQVAVAGADLTDGEVGLDVVAAAQRAHQQGALRVGGGLFLGDAALVDQALHPGVVLRDLREDAVAQQVRARVADVYEAEPLAGPQQGGERGAHALQLGVLLDHRRAAGRWRAARPCRAR